jgi:hypothetical protein
VIILVLAKAPVAGQVKTRLTPDVDAETAADLAAASLLDTLDAVLAVPASVPVIAMTGDLGRARRRTELTELISECTLLSQRGNDFASRIANAHVDAARTFPGKRVLQIGMDTPQIDHVLLTECGRRLSTSDAALGMAEDGGWWALGLRDPRHADALRRVPMSTADTGATTEAALRRRGLGVAPLPRLSDVDTMADARAVAETVPASRFAAAVRVGAR